MGGGVVRPDYYRVEVRATLKSGAPELVTLECFDLIDALGLGFYLGNALKYLWRAGKKTSERGPDLKKAITFLEQKLGRYHKKEDLLAVVRVGDECSVCRGSGKAREILNHQDNTPTGEHYDCMACCGQGIIT